jgi:hypothetical protein
LRLNRRRSKLLVDRFDDPDSAGGVGGQSRALPISGVSARLVRNAADAQEGPPAR